MEHATGKALEYMYKTWDFALSYKLKTGNDIPKLIFEMNPDSKFIKYMKSFQGDMKRPIGYAFHSSDDFTYFESEEDHNKVFDYIYAMSKVAAHHHVVPKFVVQQHAHFFLLMTKILQQVAVEGVHELKISPEQAIRLAQAKLPVKPSEITLPHKNMFVFIPKDTFAKPEMQKYLDGVKYIASQGAGSSADACKLILDCRNHIIVNLNQHTNSLSLLIITNGDQVGISVNDLSTYLDIDTLENQMSNVDASTYAVQKNLVYKLYEFYQVCHRIAIGAALVSTIKNSIIKAAYGKSSVDIEFRDRAMIAKLSKKVVMNDIRTSVILQPSMKSLRGFGTSKRSVTEAVTDDTKIIIVTRRPYEVSGHHRNQRVGKGRTEFRRVWVKQHIRNKHLLDTANPTIVTSTEMTHPIHVIEDVVKASQEVPSSPE